MVNLAKEWRSLAISSASVVEAKTLIACAAELELHQMVGYRRIYIRQWFGISIHITDGYYTFDVWIGRLSIRLEWSR